MFRLLDEVPGVVSKKAPCDRMCRRDWQAPHQPSATRRDDPRFHGRTCGFHCGPITALLFMAMARDRVLVSAPATHARRLAEGREGPQEGANAACGELRMCHRRDDAELRPEPGREGVGPETTEAGRAYSPRTQTSHTGPRLSSCHSTPLSAGPAAHGSGASPRPRSH